MKNIKISKKLLALAMASSIGLSATGCNLEPEYEEYKEPTDSYDLLNTTEENTTNSDEFDNVIKGVEQILDVSGETFKLKINYSSPEETWRITDTKELHMEINTLNLPSNKEVYIDNIHTDTSIVSTTEKLNGILQDTMDDHIHNSQMIGFPISDTNSYYGINEIEGQNEEFIKGFWIAGLGNVNQERKEESDFLRCGVWANRTDSIIDLIIVDKTTNEMRTVSVSSTLLIEICNKVYEEISYDSNYTYYNENEYDRYGNSEYTGKKLKRER